MIIFVVICQIIFGIGTAALVQWTIKKPTGVKILASTIFVLTFIASIIWAFGEFTQT